MEGVIHIKRYLIVHAIACALVMIQKTMDVSLGGRFVDEICCMSLIMHDIACALVMIETTTVDMSFGGCFVDEIYCMSLLSSGGLLLYCSCFDCRFLQL